MVLMLKENGKTYLQLIKEKLRPKISDSYILTLAKHKAGLVSLRRVTQQRLLDNLSEKNQKVLISRENESLIIS